jgi:hypothetical protein
MYLQIYLVNFKRFIVQKYFVLKFGYFVLWVAIFTAKYCLCVVNYILSQTNTLQEDTQWAKNG